MSGAQKTASSTRSLTSKMEAAMQVVMPVAATVVAQQRCAQPTGDSGATTSAQPTGDAGTQQPVRRRHDGLVEVPNAEQPNTRDLVDPITGRTVAKGGIERRVFEDGQRHARENNQLKNAVAASNRQLGSINEVTQEAVRLNVAPQDQIAAIRVMS